MTSATNKFPPKTKTSPFILAKVSVTYEALSFPKKNMRFSGAEKARSQVSASPCVDTGVVFNWTMGPWSITVSFAATAPKSKSDRDHVLLASPPPRYCAVDPPWRSKRGLFGVTRVTADLSFTPDCILLSLN